MKKDNEEQYKLIGKYIETQRLKANLTQKQLAELAGTKQSNISKIEQGKMYLDFIMALELCKAMNISYVEFMKDVDKLLDN